MRYLHITETEIMEGNKTVVVQCPDDMTEEQALAILGKKKLQAALNEIDFDSNTRYETTLEWFDEPDYDPMYDLTNGKAELIDENGEVVLAEEKQQ